MNQRIPISWTALLTCLFLLWPGCIYRVPVAERRVRVLACEGECPWQHSGAYHFWIWKEGYRVDLKVAWEGGDDELSKHRVHDFNVYYEFKEGAHPLVVKLGICDTNNRPLAYSSENGCLPYLSAPGSAERQYPEKDGASGAGGMYVVKKSPYAEGFDDVFSFEMAGVRLDETRTLSFSECVVNVMKSDGSTESLSLPPLCFRFEYRFKSRLD